MSESNKVKWIGVRQVNPNEPFLVQPQPYKGSQNFKRTSANNATVVSLTVPANTEYHITAVHFMMTGTGPGGGITRVYNPASAVVLELGYGYIGTNVYTLSQISMLSAIVLPSSWTVRVVSYTATITSVISLIYYSVSV